MARHELRGRARALYGARQLGSVAAAGRLGEADFEEHYAVIEEAAGAIERLLEGIEGGRLQEVVAVGPTRDTGRAVLRLPAVHLPVETADGVVEVELSGEGGLVWECPDRLAMLCLTGRSRAPSVRRKLADGTSVAALDRALLEPYLLLALGAVAEDPATRAFFEGRPLTVHLLCGATAVSWQLGPPPPIRARRHLTGLVADFLGLDEAGSAWRDLLPFRPITEVDSLAGALYAEEVDDALHAAYTPLLVEAIDEAGEGLHPLWSPRGGLRLLDDLAGLVPADALRKVRRRLRPILGSLEAGEARA